MIEPKVYRLKEEFCKELNIPQNQVNRRQKELFSWLTNFYDFEILYGNPIRIQINEVIGEYQPLPRKAPQQDALNDQKIEDYKNYTIAALGPNYKPNSKSHIAREAIKKMGKEKYHHNSVEAVTKRYIKRPFETYGETNDKKVWVWFSTYKPADEETLSVWMDILSQERIGVEEAACAFYRQEQGEDVTEEKNHYKKALERFSMIYGDVLVNVREWRLKN